MTANDVLKIAVADAGYTENPANSNMTKYGEWYGMNGQPWCMIAVQYWFNTAGMPLPLKTASCTTFMNYAKSVGNWHNDLAVGDVVFYSFDGGTDADHVGIIQKVNKNSIIAIEGNTSLTSNDNGGAVMCRVRNNKYILGVYRPDYENVDKNTGVCDVSINQISKGCKGKSVKALQILLIGYGYSCGACGADGDFGSDTDTAVRAFQRDMCISVDGIVGVNTWGKLLK